MKQIKKLIAGIVVLSFFLGVLIPYLSKVKAGTFTSASLTLTNSQASATSVGYNFAFTTTVTTSIKQLTIQFCTAASGTCTTPTGMTTTGATRSTDNLAGTGRTDTFTSNGTLTTVVTTPSTQSTQAVTVNYTGITNSSTTNTTFFARITTYSDTGSTIIDGPTAVASATLDTTSIAISATIDPSLSVTVAGVASSASVNSSTTTITTTATTIPLGTMTSGSSVIGAHDVTVTTNATSGYVTTVHTSASNPLTSGANNFSPFTGTYGTPTTWSAPAGTSANTNTAFFGYTTEDTNVSAFQTNKWAGTETTARTVISNSTGASSRTKRLGWQAQINALQPAGSYTGTVILITTPTY